MAVAAVVSGEFGGESLGWLVLLMGLFVVISVVLHRSHKDGRA